MSKIKNPSQKKDLSLKRDRRNVFGENSKSSRKNISKGKRRQHMDERRAVSHVLRRITGEVDDDFASSAELQVKVTIVDSRNRGFKKRPDRPLGVILAHKKSRGRILGESRK